MERCLGRFYISVRSAPREAGLFCSSGWLLCFLRSFRLGWRSMARFGDASYQTANKCLSSSKLIDSAPLSHPLGKSDPRFVITMRKQKIVQQSRIVLTEPDGYDPTG